VVIRALMLSVLAVTSCLQVADRVWLRSLPSLKSVGAVDVRDGSVTALPLETQEIVNTDSVLSFSKDALVVLFNYRPGQAKEHVLSREVEKLFINKAAHDKFVKQFLAWSNHEFNVNNISIKESIVSQGSLLMTPSVATSGARLWQYRATLPMVDRGVGKSLPSTLNVIVSMVYLGPEGGMGLYSVRLSL